ncbi:DEAD/DEAH box helicase [Nocardioides panacihumi]|uniref:DEAD/DEAH box helicase n=1 Tax=Nocardioides panacihumi TaxID=400774 RepID=A0ABN2QGF6_9ACTN
MSFVPLTGPAVLTVGDRPRDGSVTFQDERRTLSLPIVSAVPVLTKAFAREATHPSVGLLGASAHFALRLVAAGKFEETADGWAPVVVGDDVQRLRMLAESRAYDGVDREGAEALVWSMVAAVVDAMPRGSMHGATRRATAAVSPARPAAAGPAADRLRERLQRHLVPDDTPAEVSISLRVEADEESLTQGVLRVVLQVHDEANPLHLADAAVLWRDDPREHGFGPRTRSQVAMRLADASRAWPPLQRMRFQASPTEMELEGDDIGSLLADGVAALKEIGVDVLWPRALGRELTARPVVDAGPRPSGTREEALNTGLFGVDDLFSFKWQLAIGDEPLTDEEMDELAGAAAPILKLRGSWTIVDPGIARKARKRMLRKLTPAEALGAALTGVADVDSEARDVIVGATLAKLRDRVAEVGRGDLVPVPAGLQATLRDYQRRGLTWLAELTALGLGGCLADDMGLGKTITLIALHLHRAAGPTLVVCPTSLMGNWEAEVARFAPGVTVRRHHGRARDLDDIGDGIVLTTYGTMRRDARLLAEVPWDLVVADEAQHLKNAASSTARQMRLIPGRARVALTGTPVENDLSELWAILDWAVPGLLGSRKAFRKAWAAPIEAGIEVTTRQFTDLVAPFLLRRRKSDPGIAPELPPKTETDQLLSLTKEQTVLYQAYVRDTMERIERLPGDDPARRGLVLMMLTGLKQICNHPAQFLKHGAESGGRGRIAGRSQKIELLDEVIETATSEGGAVLVFTQYVAMAQLLSAHWTATGVPHLFLHGGTPVRERERMVAAFQDAPDGQGVPVFLLSLKAGGTGLNLTRADHVVHVDRWWNPAVEDQATDRAYRIGQTKPVQVHRLVMRGTLEERIALLLDQKRSLAEAVLGRGETALTELSDAELRDLVSLRPES